MRLNIITKILTTLIIFFITIISFYCGFYLGVYTEVYTYELKIIPMLGLLGQWLGAIGTCGAVVVSLWLAFKQLNKDREMLKCNLNMLISPGFQTDAVLGLTIVSVGNRPSNITSISWVSEHANTNMLVVHYHQMSAVLPKTLAYGEQVILIHQEGFEKHLANYINNHAAGIFEDLFVSINTTTTSIKIKADAGMLQRIRESIK